MNKDLQEQFGLTDDEQQLRDSVAQFLRKTAPAGQRNRAGGTDTSQWHKFVELGWTDACVPAAAGGYGETGREALIIAERFGAHCMTEPLVAAVYAPVRLLCADTDVMQRHAELIARVANGKARLGIAWAEAGRPSLREPQAVIAEPSGDRWRLRGRKVGVLGAPSASAVIVSAQAAGKTALFLVPQGLDGVQTHAYRVMGGLQSADLVFNDVDVPADALIATGDTAAALLERGLDSGASAACAYMVGAMESALGITADYARTRKQFGQTIGSFQVVQHRLVDMALDLEYARSCNAILLNAAFLKHGSGKAPAALAGARSEIMRRAQHVVADAIQLHGGIGMTEEASIGHYFKCVATLANTWGNADVQLEAYRSARSDVADLLAL